MKSSPHCYALTTGDARPPRRWFVRLALSVLLGLSLLADSRLPPGAGSPQVANAAGTFTVNSFADEVDNNLNGVCATASNDCTLRAAIQEANFSPGADTINLPAGVFVLSLGPAGDDVAASGDLDITSDITINGPSLGSGMAIIDGNVSDRVIEIHSGSVTIDRVTIRNAGESGGGILTRGTSNLALTNSTISSNSGGGLFNLSGGNINITNSTISGNNSSTGGGIYTDGGAVRLANVTITGNTGATLGGGGIRIDANALLVSMKNSILAENTGTPGPNCRGTLTSGGYNLFGDITSCNFDNNNDLTGQLPQLGLLLDNGGPSFTHALLPNSPALNTGNLNGCKDIAGTTLLAADQRGTDRPQGGRCDIGAYEVPAVKFQNQTYSVSEVSPTAAITAMLDGLSAYTVTVSYTTTNGTATAGSDYTTTVGQLTFPPFDSPKSFAVPIMNDGTFEGNETVNLALGSLVGATPGSPSTAVRTITSDDPPPSVQFSSSTYTATEASTAAITVTLSPPSESVARVNYATGNGTAIAGSDYTTATGTLTFAPLETSRVVNVTILHDSADEPNETFTVTFTNPLSATIAGTVPVTVTILDDDLPGVYLPIVMRTFSKFFTGFEVDPNNKTAEANGPLGSGMAINGYPDDARDYFHFTSGSVGTITVNLTGHTGQGVQLQLFYQSTSNLVTYDPTPPFSIQVGNRPAGFYIVIIYAASGYNSTTPYTLVVTYPP